MTEPIETTPAIRTVSETDDTHTIELRLAYGGPFRGKDTYRTSFTPKTDWALDLHPEGVPILFNHGFDDDFGLKPIGRTSPTDTFRTDKDGMWVQAQLDKRHQYYATRVRPLLDAGALGASQGSAEHSVRIDGKTGEVQLWPLQEISLTPTEANPWNMIAARSGETARLLVVGTRAAENYPDVPAEDFAGPDRSFPITDAGSVSAAAHLIGKADNPDAVKAKIIAIAKRKGFEAQLPKAWTEDGARTAFRSAADDVACATNVQSLIAYLMDREDDEPEQLAMLSEAFAAVGKFVTSEAAEIGSPEDESEEDAMPPAVYTALRAGKRNAAGDQALIDQIHDRTVQLGASAHAEPADAQPNDDSPPAESDEDAARSGDSVPRIHVIREPANPDAVRASVDEAVTALARESAQAVVSSFVRRPSTP